MHNAPFWQALTAYQFRQDPRVQAAKSLLLEALQDHQKEITHVRPPKLEMQGLYANLLETFVNYRGGPLYFPYIGSGFGHGALVELLDGSVKYDMISGIGTHYWGHSHPDILLSNIEAALSDTVMQGHLQQNLDSLELSQLLIHASNLDHCFLSSSGAMANENALKIALQKKFPAHRILAFDKCFMGRTLALAQITDKPGFREGLPSNLGIDYIPFYQADYPEESTKRAIEVLKTHLKRYPKQHAVMCFELIQGEGGFHLGSTDFFIQLMEILKEQDIAIFIDEVQTFGRTSSLFAYQYFQLEKYVDIVSLGKLSQICATLFRNEFKPKPGLLSQTFTSSTSAIHASKYIIQHLLQDHYLGPQGRITQIHTQFVQAFQEIEKRHPHLLQGPYGIGSMIAFTPFDGELAKVTKFIQDLFQAGVISFIAGALPSRVRFLVPAGVITDQDIQNVVQIVEAVLIRGGT